MNVTELIADMAQHYNRSGSSEAAELLLTAEAESQYPDFLVTLTTRYELRTSEFEEPADRVCRAYNELAAVAHGIMAARKQLQPAPPVEPVAAPVLVRCDCGHEIPAGLVMRASRGTACPDCYDDMSD
jgi:hypothetical protein